MIWKRFKVVVLKLTNYASLWYENLKGKRRRERKPKLESWESLKKRMKKRFLPSDYVQDMYLKLQAFKQNSLSVDEYINEFEWLNIMCDLEERTEHKIARFITGLERRIAKKVDLRPHWTFEEVCNMALKVEKYTKGMKVANPKPYTKPFSKVVEDKGGSYTNKFTPKFEKFKKDERKSSGPLTGEDKRICFKCKGYGHVIKDFPSNRVMTLRDVQEIEETYAEAMEEEKEEDEGACDGNDYEADLEEEPMMVGKQLILRRALHT